MTRARVLSVGAMLPAWVQCVNSGSVCSQDRAASRRRLAKPSGLPAEPLVPIGVPSGFAALSARAAGAAYASSAEGPYMPGMGTLFMRR